MQTDANSTPGLQIIGLVQSPFKEKFGIPRQPGLVDMVEGRVVMQAPFDDPLMFAGLEDFSHVWLSFLFHDVMDQGWRPRVRPPRLGGNQQVGVFASRSPYRPNHLGLSVVRLLGVDKSAGVSLRVRGLDLLDGTPVVDIKPYLPYVDSIPHASGGFAPGAPSEALEVVFSPKAREALADIADLKFEQLIARLLALDPRPAYRRREESERIYGMRLEDFNITWKVAGGQLEVLEIHNCD
jgi:tRNA-Thr(GGU) m(6)t(6)A37 methyltransferase TsaA